METKKTAPEWFNELPDGYRERALRACTDKIGLYGSMSEALRLGIYNWEETIERENFWISVYTYYRDIAIDDTAKYLPHFPPDSELDKPKEAEPPKPDEDDFDYKIVIIKKDGEFISKCRAKDESTNDAFVNYITMLEVTKSGLIRQDQQ